MDTAKLTASCVNAWNTPKRGNICQCEPVFPFSTTHSSMHSTNCVAGIKAQYCSFHHTIKICRVDLKGRLGQSLVQHTLLLMCQGYAGIQQTAQLLRIPLDVLRQTSYVPLQARTAVKLDTVRLEGIPAACTSATSCAIRMFTSCQQHYRCSTAIKASFNNTKAAMVMLLVDVCLG